MEFITKRFEDITITKESKSVEIDGVEYFEFEASCNDIDGEFKILMESEIILKLIINVGKDYEGSINIKINDEDYVVSIIVDSTNNSSSICITPVFEMFLKCTFFEGRGSDIYEFLGKILD